MKTIDEIAKEIIKKYGYSAEDLVSSNRESIDIADVYGMLVEIATEQKAIDDAEHEKDRIFYSNVYRQYGRQDVLDVMKEVGLSTLIIQQVINKLNQDYLYEL